MLRPFLTSLLAFAVSCGGAHPVHPTTVTRASGSPAPPSAAPAEPASETTLAPVIETAWAARRENDGTLRVVYGSLRADLFADSVRIGQGQFASAIGQATPVANGWVFVTADGTVARSREFTGALERLGAIPRALGPSRYTRGRMAVVDDAGTVWSTDGTAPVAAVTSLPDERALAVVFRSVADGAVVLAGGLLFRTMDGGASWHAVALGTAGAFDVYLRGNAIVVSTTDGDRGLSPDGTLGDPPPVTGLEHPRLDDRQRRRLVRAARDRYPVLLDAMDHGVHRSDGTVLIAQGRDVLVLDGHDGHEIRIVPDAISDGCSLVSWGPAVAAVCPYLEPSLYRSTDGEHFDPVEGHVGYAPVLSDDGHHAARERGCPGDADDAGPEAFCALRGDGHWITRSAGGEVEDVVAMHGPSALVRLTPASRHDPELVIVDVETGDRHPLRTVHDDALDDARIAWASWTADGVITGLASASRSTGAPRVLLIGMPDQPLTVRALPVGTLAVGFADGRRGIAAGSDITKLWLTRDGGEHWRTITVPVDGAADAVTIRVATLVREGVICERARCIVGDRIRVEGFGEPRVATDTVLAALHGMPSRLEGNASVSLPDLRCDIDRGHRGASALDPAGSGTVLMSAGVRARIHAATDTPQRWTADVRWRGSDPHGAFRGSSRARALDFSAASSDTHEPGYILRGATRAGMLFERCSGEFSGDCLLFWAANGGAIQRVEAFDRMAHDVDARVRVFDTLPLDDGGMLALLHASTDSASVEQVLVLGPDGTVRARRGFAWEAEDQLRALGRFRGAGGYVVGEVTDPFALRFYPIAQDPGAQPVHLARFATGDANVCSGIRPPESAEIVATQSGYLPGVTVTFSGASHDVRAWLEVGPSGTCVRSVESWVGESAGFDRARWTGDGLDVRVSDRGMSGVSGPQPVRCEGE